MGKNTITIVKPTQGRQFLSKFSRSASQRVVRHYSTANSVLQGPPHLSVRGPSPPTECKVVQFDVLWDKGVLSRLALHMWRSNLALNVLLCALMTVCRGWLALAVIAGKIFSGLFSLRLLPGAEIHANHCAHLFVQLDGFPHGYVASPAHYLMKENTSKHTDETSTGVS